VRAGVLARSDGAMNESSHPTTTLSLRLEIGSEPIRGCIDPHGEPVPFAGWLALAEALERAHGGDGCPPPAPAGAEAVMRRYFAAVQAGDWPAAYGLLADDVVLHVPGSTPLSGVHRGRDAAIAYVEGAIARAHAADIEVELVELLAGRERVALLLIERFGCEDGPVEILRANVYRVADGEIVEVHVFEGDQAAADALFG
jgi:uncharacterized protein